MTPEQLKELRSLLIRIKDAGGPVTAEMIPGLPLRIWLGERDNSESYLTTGTTRDAMRDAALIHALTLDAEARGVEWEAANDVGSGATRYHVALKEWADGAWEDLSIGSSASEAIAWCLAWLTAFEVAE